MYGITSEPQSLAEEAEAAWDMSISVVGDPHLEIREDLSSRGVLDIFYNPDAGHLRERSWASHPNGYYQPAVVALSKSGQILYRWRCVPRYSNMSGAGGRPEARYTWDLMQKSLQSNQDAAPDKAPEMGAGTLSWFRFLVILVAHGWFVRPRAFPLLRDGAKAKVTPADAMRRAYLFAGAWIIALILLPLAWVVVGFVSWLLLLTPGLLEIHRQFQNEPDAY